MRTSVLLITLCLVTVALGQSGCCIPAQFTAEMQMFNNDGTFANLEVIFDAPNHRLWSYFASTQGEYYIWNMYNEQKTYVFDPASGQCYKQDENGTLTQYCVGQNGGQLVRTITLGGVQAQVWAHNDTTNDVQTNVVVSVDKCFPVAFETFSLSADWTYKDFEIYVDVQPTANGFPAIPPACAAAKPGCKASNLAAKLTNQLALKRLTVN